MRLRKEYIVLFLVIAALVLYITLRKENRIQYDIPDVAELMPDSITEIVIDGEGKETVLIKDKGQWLIGQDKYLADAYKIEKMINFLVKPVLTTVVSDSKDYMRYGLDSKNRIIVKTFSGDKVQRLVEIGYPADVRNYTFIKLENDYRVYHAKEDLRDIFSTDIDDIRDKTVLSFKVDEIESVQLLKDGKESYFNREKVPSDGGENKNVTYRWETGDGKMIDDASVNSLLDDVLKIKCSNYLYDTKKDELGDPEYVIKVTGKNTHLITVFPKKEEDDYTCSSSDNPSIFKLYSWRVDNIIEKFDKMLGIGEKDESDS